MAARSLPNQDTLQRRHKVKLLFSSGYTGRAKKKALRLLSKVEAKVKESQLYEVAQLCKVYSVAAIDISNALYAADYFLLYVPADFSRHEDAVRQAKVALASTKVKVVIISQYALKDCKADAQLYDMLLAAAERFPGHITLSNEERMEVAEEILARCRPRRREHLSSLLEESLRSAKQAAMKYFQGTRPLLFQQLQQWAAEPITSANHKPVALITGEAFLGKTVALAQACNSSGVFSIPQRRGSSSSNPQADYSAQCTNPLYQPFSAAIGASFFGGCCGMRGFDARACLLCISQQLSYFIGGSFRRMTDRAYRRHGFESFMARLPLEELFLILFEKPIGRLAPPNTRILVVIDGIDQCRSAQREAFFDLIFRKWQALPSWLSLLCTSRPVKSIAPFAYNVEMCEMLEIGMQEQVQDAQTFAYEKLYSLMPLSGHSMSRNVELVCAHTRFSLHCLDVLQFYMMSNVQDGDKLTHVQLKRLVEEKKFSKLIYDSLYAELLKLYVEMGTSRYHAFIDPLAVSREPVPLDLYSNALGLKAVELGQNLAVMDLNAQTVELPLPARARKFLTKRERKVSCPSLFVDRSTAHRAVSTWCRDHPDHNYALRNALYHFSDSRLSQDAAELLMDFEWLVQALTSSSPSHLARDISAFRDWAGRKQDCLSLAEVLRQSETALIKDPREVVAQCFAQLPASHPLVREYPAASLENLRAFSRGEMPFLRPIGVFSGTGNSETRTLSIGEDHVVTGRSDHAVCVYEIVSGQLKQILTGHVDQIVCVVQAHGWVISGSRDKTARIWDLQSGALVQELPHEDWVLRVCVGSCGQVLVCLTAQMLYVWDTKEACILRKIKEGRWDSFGLCSGRLGIASSLSNEVMVWDVAVEDAAPSVEKRFECRLTSKLFNWAQDLAMKEKLLVCCTSFDVYIWGAEDGKLRHKMTKTGHFNNQLYVDECMIVSLERRQSQIRVWDIATGKDITPDELDLHDFQGDLPLLISGPANKSCRLPFNGVGFSTRTTAYQHMCRLGAARCIDGKVVRPAVVVESSGQLTMFHCHSSSQTKILAGQLEAQQD